MIMDRCQPDKPLISPLRSVVGVVVALIFAAGCLSCGKVSSGEGAANGGCSSITVSVPPLEYFAKTIGGDSVEVVTLLPAGADPETFEPGVGVMRSLAADGVLALTGTLPFEETLLKNMRANNHSLRTYSMAEGIGLIYGTHEHHGHEAESGTPHKEGNPDPHIWSSVKNARIIAANMLKALIAASPNHKVYYTRRYEALMEHLDSLDCEFSTRIGRAQARAFMIWHPSLSYFARDYGLKQIAFNVENKETSPLRLQGSLKVAAENVPEAFFVAEGFDKRRAEAIASETGISPTAVNLMSADWEGALRTVVCSLSDSNRVSGGRVQ